MHSIYKYIPHYDGLFFENFLLRATPRNELNDPFEFVPPREFYEMAINCTKPGEDLEWIKRISYDQFSKRFYPFEGVICFTETRSNLLMWSHYAQKHTGLVIEFDSSNDFFKDLKHVRYDNIKPNNITNLNELFFIKSDEWIYEKEHRIVKRLSEHNFYIKKSEMTIHIAKNSATHYPDNTEEMYMFLVPKVSIKSVTFGCNINASLKEKIINKIRSDKEIQNVVLWQTNLSKDYFYLEFEEMKNI